MIFGSTSTLAWVPFVTPAPIWDAWVWLLLPLLFGVSVAYKAVRVSSPRRLVIESMLLTVYLLVGLVGAALILAGFVAWAL